MGACARRTLARPRLGYASRRKPRARDQSHRPHADRGTHRRSKRRRTVMIGFTFGFSSFFILLAILVVASSIRIFREYERGVVFTLGRFWKVKGPGLVLIAPIIQQAVRMDLRTVVFDVPPQDVITRDN